MNDSGSSRINVRIERLEPAVSSTVMAVLLASCDVSSKIPACDSNRSLPQAQYAFRPAGLGASPQIRLLQRAIQAGERSAASRFCSRRSIPAVAHKMLRMMLAMIRDNEPHRDPGIYYQALVVQCNASRWLRNLERCGYLEALRAAPAASAKTPRPSHPGDAGLLRP